MSFLTQVLFTLSSALMAPVIILLIVLVVRSIMEIGGVLCEWRQRRMSRDAWLQWFQSVACDERLAVDDLFSRPDLPGLVGVFANRASTMGRSRRLIEKLENDMEILAAKQLGRMSLGIRIGPILGMMGTLIPLGPALISLSNDNVSEMANDLVVAFSTTVLGLLVGGISYCLWLSRRNWYAQDLADIEFARGVILSVPPLPSPACSQATHLSSGENGIPADDLIAGGERQ